MAVDAPSGTRTRTAPSETCARAGAVDSAAASGGQGPRTPGRAESRARACAPPRPGRAGARRVEVSGRRGFDAGGSRDGHHTP